MDNKYEYMDNKHEIILVSAIWYKELPTPLYNPINVNKGMVFCGYRHCHCMYQMIALTGKRSVENECGEHIQGFLTNKNRFVDRKEAARIAYAANQIDSYWDSRNLFSEDLY